MLHRPNGVDSQTPGSRRWSLYAARLINRESDVCRSPPPAIQISESSLEKIDAQILLARGGKVPAADHRGMRVCDNLRPGTNTRD